MTKNKIKNKKNKQTQNKPQLLFEGLVICIKTWSYIPGKEIKWIVQQREIWVPTAVISGLMRLMDISEFFTSQFWSMPGLCCKAGREAQP